MLRKQYFVNKLRELGYTFKARQKRTELWRKKGGTHCVDVPLSNSLPETYVRMVMRQCGQTTTQIEAFIREAKC
jgi:hypothetical protein